MEKVRNIEGQKLENELVEFIDSKYAGKIDGRQISVYIDKKFGGDISSAIMFLATKKTQKAKDTAKALMYYQEAMDAIRKQKQKVGRRHIKDRRKTNAKKLTGYERFEYLCGAAKIPLTDALLSENELPIISVPVMKGLPQHPTKDNYRIIIPKKYLTDENREKLWRADKAEIKILEVSKNNIYVDLIKTHVRPKVEPRYIIAIIHYDKYQGVYIESKDTKKRITVPKDILPKLIGKKGAWQMQVLKEGDDFIHVLPIEAKPELDPEPQRFIAIVKFDDHMGIRIKAPGMKKRITVPKDILPELTAQRGAWEMQVLKEGPDYIHALPIERLEDGKVMNRKMNTLLTDGKISW